MIKINILLILFTLKYLEKGKHYDKKIIGEEKEKKPIYKKWWFILLVICFIIGTLNNIFGDKSEEIISKNVENTLSSAGVKNFTLERDESLDGNNQTGYRAKIDFSKTGIIIHLIFEGKDYIK